MKHPPSQGCLVLMTNMVAASVTMVNAGTYHVEDSMYQPMTITTFPSVLDHLMPLYVENGPAPPPTPLENLGHNAEVAATRSQTASSDATSVASEVGARLDAENADLAAYASQEAADKTVSDQISVKGAVQQLQQTQQNIAFQANAVKAAFDQGSQYYNNLEAMSASKATTAIKAQLAPLYKRLQDWKMAVLHDPVREGRAAGMRAAKPYEDALKITERRTAAVEQKAASLSSQARGLRINSYGLANGAVLKQAAGDLGGAAQDMMNAHQMMNQAAAFEVQGLELQKTAQALAVNIPAYAKAAQDAAHLETFKMAKHKFAPPPMPPPGAALPLPVNILAQRRSTLRRQKIGSSHPLQ